MSTLVYSSQVIAYDISLHVDYIKEKAWPRVNAMRKLKFKIDRKSLKSFTLHL